MGIWRDRRKATVFVSIDTINVAFHVELLGRAPAPREACLTRIAADYCAHGATGGSWAAESGLNFAANRGTCAR